MRKHLLPIAACICTALSLATFAAAPTTPATPAAPAKATVGKEAPAFTLNDSNGKPVSLADHKGKVVVLEWINRDCPIDKRVIESKRISTVSEKFKDKVVWLAIDSTAAHTKPDYDKTISDFKLTYPLLNDAKGVVGKIYDAKTTPQIYIINAAGVLVYNGAIDDDPNGTNAKPINYADRALTELLDGKTVTIAESKPYGCNVKY